MWEGEYLQGRGRGWGRRAGPRSRGAGKLNWGAELREPRSLEEIKDEWPDLKKMNEKDEWPNEDEEEDKEDEDKGEKEEEKEKERNKVRRKEEDNWTRPPVSRH